MKKPIVKVIRSYLFGLIKREIIIKYEIINGNIIFERPLKSNEQVVISYTYNPDIKSHATYIKEEK